MQRDKAPTIHPAGLTRVFAFLAVVFVVVLATAPLRPYFSEWRNVQTRYNRLAASSGIAPIPIGIQQIWRPELNVTDRCVTCHLAMGSAPDVPGDPLFRRHSPIPHEPQKFGCTLCHGGQGRATTRDAAHGFVSHWDEQLLEGSHLQAGCGTCHDSLPAVSRAELERGSRLYEALDCLSCHRVDGRGRASGSDLSYVGLKGFRPDWHDWHLSQKDSDRTGKWQASYGPLRAEELRALQSFLKTRIGAPRLIEAQAIVLERGCLGCHRIGERGGDEGPPLDRVGTKPIGDLDFTRVKGEKTLSNYLLRHLADPPGVVPGSLMPPQSGNIRELELMTSYVLSLRSRDLPFEYHPKERIRRTLLGAGREPQSGGQLYSSYCSGCHAPNGRGRNYANLEQRFPAIGSADFLDTAPDEFLLKTLESGRPGRKMPAIRSLDKDLDPAAIGSLIAYLRAFQPPPVPWVSAQEAVSDPSLGRSLYARDCATCHGSSGEGTALGPPLAARDNPARMRRESLHAALVQGIGGTAMPPYRSYDSRAVRSVIDYIASLPPVSTSRQAWKPASGDPRRGREVFDRTCVGCHGARGAGKSGPALDNAGFLNAATTAFISTTIVRGRAGTPMPAFGADSTSFRRLSPEEILHVTAYVKNGLSAGSGKE